MPARLVQRQQETADVLWKAVVMCTGEHSITETCLRSGFFISLCFPGPELVCCVPVRLAREIDSNQITCVTLLWVCAGFIGRSGTRRGSQHMEPISCNMFPRQDGFSAPSVGVKHDTDDDANRRQCWPAVIVENNETSCTSRCRLNRTLVRKRLPASILIVLVVGRSLVHL